MKQRVTVFKYHLFVATSDAIAIVYRTTTPFWKSNSSKYMLWNNTSEELYYITSASNYLPSKRILNKQDVQELIDMNIAVNISFLTLEDIYKKQIFMSSQDIMDLKNMGFTNWENSKDFCKKCDTGVYNVTI